MTEEEPISAPSRLLTLALFVIAVGVTFAAWFYHTDPGQFALLGHETLVFLEGTARVMQGDLPNHDFSSPLGPATWVIPNIFLSETQLWLVVPVLLIAVTGLAALLATALLRSENIAQFLVLLAVMAFCAMVINAPSSDGGTLLWRGIPSNIASALLILITAWITLRLTTDRPPLTWFGAALLGLALLLLFTLKVLYFFAALALLLSAFRTLAQDATRALAAFITPLLFMTVLFPAMTIGYITDIAYSVNFSQFDLPQILADAQEMAPQYAIEIAALFALGFLVYRADPSRTQALFLLLLVCVVITLLIDLFDGQPSQSALLLGLIAGLAFALLAKPVWPLACLPLIILPTAFSLEAYAKGIALQQNHALAGTVDTVTYNRIRLDLLPGFPVYVRTAEAAFAHLDQTASAECLEQGYIVADATNPFGALLARPGAPVEYIWIDSALASMGSSPSEFDVFTGDAAFILIPKTPIDTGATQFVTRVYEAELDDLSVVHENDGWKVYGVGGC